MPATIEQALQTVPANRQAHWRAIWTAKPELLLLDTPCPKCGAKPYESCMTPSYFPARRIHAERQQTA